MTSEKSFGVPPQPKETCPLIDQAIKEATEARKWVLNGNSVKANDAISELIGYQEAESLEESRSLGVSGLLEEIRSANHAIRYWGQGWKDKAKELYEENEAQARRINELENKLIYHGITP